MIKNIDLNNYILNEDFTGKLSEMKLPEMPSIFNIENLFQEGMNEEKFVEQYENYIASALYSLESGEFSEVFDISKLAEDEIAMMEDVAKQYFAAIDKDKNGVLSEDEIAVVSSKDGDSTSISNEDLNIFTSEIFKDETVEENNFTFSKLDKSFNLTSPNSHSSNYSSPDITTPASVDSAEEINKQIAEINGKYSPLLEQKKALMADNKEYVSLVSQSQQLNQNIILSENTIEKYESQLHDVKYDLNAARSELSNLQDAVVFEDYQSVIDERRAALRSQISSLEGQERDLEAQVKQEKANRDNLITQKDAVVKQISDIESENPNSKINDINNDLKKLDDDKAALQQKLSDIREQALSDAEVYGKAQAYRNSEFAANLLNPLLTEETKARYDKYYFESHGYSYCDQFVKNGVDAYYKSVLENMGLTEEQINNYMAYESSILSQGGINPKYIAGSEYVRECSSTKTWGEDYQKVLDAAGIDHTASLDMTNMTDDQMRQLVREGKIYPGMTFLTLKNGQYHVGFIESVNKDLTINTIEGNTFIRYADGSSETGTVGSHTHNPADMSLVGLSDINSKVYYWLKMSGYSDEEINRYIYKI